MKKKTMVILIVASLLLCLGCILWDCATATTIPKLYFYGDISDMNRKSDVRHVFVTYQDGAKVFRSYAKLKIQGDTSTKFEKKNYTIKFYSDNDGTKERMLDVGWGAHNKYCLKANWIDRPHARNLVTAKLARKVQEKYNLLTQAPCNGLVDGFPVEVYSNGAFLELYTFNIPKSAWLFGMESGNPNHIVLCSEAWTPSNTFHEAPNLTDWSIVVGEESEETLEKAYQLYDFIRNSTDEEFVADFEKHLDLDAALNYYVLADVAYLPDNCGKNIMLVTYDGVKWYLSLYDMDTAWGTDWEGSTVYNYAKDPMNHSSNVLFSRMEQCFPGELAERYRELRQDVLSNESIMAEFVAFRNQIPRITFLREGMKWGSGFIRSTDDLPGFDYDQIEDYLNTVPAILDMKYAEFASRQ